MSYVSQDLFDKMWARYQNDPGIASIAYCPVCNRDALCLKPAQMRRIAWVSASHNRACLECGWRSIHTPVKNRKLRAAVFAADDNECVYCGRNERLGIDHVIAQTRGGGHSFDNLLTCCHWCNTTKKDRNTLIPRFGRYRNS